jgi:hypothetical protein
MRQSCFEQGFLTRPPPPPSTQGLLAAEAEEPRDIGGLLNADLSKRITRLSKRCKSKDAVPENAKSQILDEDGLTGALTG